MAFIGNQPSESFTSFATQEFSTSATTSYTLDHAVANENEIALFVNNVRQQPGSGKAYTATGTTLTLSAATASTDTMYCVFLGRALQTVTPATNSITAAMVGNDLISGKDALTSSPDDTDELLISDAGTLKRIDVSLVGGKNTPMFLVGQTSGQTISNTSFTKITFDNEDFDTDSAFDLSNNRFTVPSGAAGKYFFSAWITGDDNIGYDRFHTAIYVNGSQANFAGSSSRYLNHAYPNLGSGDFSYNINFIYNASAGDYFEVYLYQDSGGNVITTEDRIWFYGYKLIG